MLGEVFVSPELVGDHIKECIANNDHDIDLSADGWVSVNDILIEEGHAYDYHGGKKKDFVVQAAKEITEAKEEASKDYVDKTAEEKQKQKRSNTYKIVVPYATETTTQSYKEITWSN